MSLIETIKTFQRDWEFDSEPEHSDNLLRIACLARLNRFYKCP
jgi:hypothetical protein